MKTEERRHHSYSPSTLQLFESCGLYGKRSTAGAAARTGTKQHKVTETGQDDQTLTDEQVAMAAECMTFVQQKKDEMLNAEYRPDGYEEVVDITEPYLPVDDRRWEAAVFNDKTGELDFVWEDCTTGGYADRLLVYNQRKEALLFDWKFGLWPVEVAQNNLQGICYVLGVFFKYPHVDKVTIYFKLPQQEDVTSHTFERREAAELLLRVKVIVARADFLARQAARDHDAYEAATESVPACLFCSRIGFCPKVQKLVIKVGQKYHPVEFPESIDTTLLRDPKDFAKGMRLAQVVEAWAKGYKSQGTQQVLLGRVPCPEGFKIYEHSEREIVDVEKFRDVALKYISPDEYMKTLKPGLGKVEELISEKAPRGAKEATVKEFGKALFEASAVQRTTPVPFLKAVPKKADKK